MSRSIFRFALAAALATVPLASHALGTNEKGCLVGGAGGALAGNLIGGNSKGTLIGGALAIKKGHTGGVEVRLEVPAGSG